MATSDVHILGFPQDNPTQADLAHASRIAALGQLTASIAHEVIQPLAAVVTNGEAGLRWLLRGESEHAEVEAAIRRTIAEAERASRIVSRIRALVRRDELAMDAVDVNALITDTSALLSPELAAAEVRLTIEVTPGLPPIRGDLVQLQQVLINLGLNAIQAMSGAGSVNRSLAIAASPTPEGVLLEVRDSGPGLADEIENRLFEAFVTTKSSGMGLGLAISRSIIERHGGKLWAERLAGASGACFRMTVLTHAGVCGKNQ